MRQQRLFVAAHALVWLSVAAWCVAKALSRWRHVLNYGLENNEAVVVDRAMSAAIAALLIFTPVISTWIVAALWQCLRPRKLFNPELRRGWDCVVLGGVSGVGAVALTILQISYLGGLAADSILLAVSCMLSTALVLLIFGGRVRPGRCLRCDYDLRGTSSLGRCPECGLPLTLRAPIRAGQCA
jgi:hypothetical protein